MLYVIQVRAGNEKNILEKCRQRICLPQEEVFVPTYDRKKKYHGEEILVTSTLFPGYVFFDTADAESLFFRLKKIPELTKLIRLDDKFIPVTRQEEENLYLLGGSTHHISVSIGVIEGSNVHILSGPLENFTGPILHVNRHKKLATIGIELAGKLNEVEIGLEIINKT